MLRVPRKLACSLFTLVGCAVGLFGWLRVGSDAPPLGSRRITGPPASAVNDPARTVYLGQGCFWHTQYDFVRIERDPAGPFGGRADAQVTALTGYAGGRFAGPAGAVCYHGNPSTDYSRLGHSEAVAVVLDDDEDDESGNSGGPGGGPGGGAAAANGTSSRRGAQFVALLEHYFQDGFVGAANTRQDPQDRGAQYRNIVGLPGGSGGGGGALYAALQAAAAARGMPLLQGAGGLAGDTADEGVVYVYDSAAFPFYRGEEVHQFHRNSVLGRAVPASYTGALKAVQAGAGRLGDPPGCAGGAVGAAAGRLLLPAFGLGLLASVVLFGQAVCAVWERRGEHAAGAQGIELPQPGAAAGADADASALAVKTSVVTVV